MSLLSDHDIDAALKTLDGWEHVDGALRKSVTFPTFIDGIEWVRTVAELAELADHHPDIDIRYRTVTFTLSTHSAGGITGRDVLLAKEINEALAGQ